MIQKQTIIYYYDGNKLGHESTIKNNKYLSNKNEIVISVQKKLRIIKCPKCNFNDCIINLNNYLASFYGCKFRHLSNATYDNYINLQRIDSDILKCNGLDCMVTQKNYIKGFYKCLTCSEIMRRSKYFCKDHIDQHHKEYISVKYDKQNYYCEKHFNIFTKYCFAHHQNICKECEKEHENDKIANYQEMTPDINKLKESFKKMEKNIEDLKQLLKI